MAEKLILAETTYTLDSGYLEIAPAPFVLVEGETYRVVLDGMDYELTCISYDGLFCLFNSVTDDAGNVTYGTFIIYHIPGNEGGVAAFEIFAEDQTHTLAIYQIVEEETFLMVKKSSLKLVADSIRGKAGIEGELEFPNGFKTAIEGITAGDGSSDDVRYVTFMSEDGTVELGKLPVATGYDCPNPKFAVTKESTAQFNFTHDYWATEPNGATDTNALKAVTEDRVVYATFISVLRSYTITYYDGNAVLKTESLAYGSTPNYTPEKDGYGFSGWEPEIAVVTGNANYTAVWAEKITFANASWAQIAEIAENGEAKNNFAIGDIKTIALNFSGTTENVQIRIIGFDHDDLENGNKAAISIALAQGIVNSATEITESSNYYYWTDSVTRTLLNSGAVWNALPSDLQSKIKSVVKKSNGCYGKNTIYTTTDKVWLLSHTEIGLESEYEATYVAYGQGEQYEYYDAQAKRKLNNTDGAVNYSYPTRSMYTKNLASSVCVDGSTGNKKQAKLGYSAAHGKTSYPKMFGFCI